MLNDKEISELNELREFKRLHDSNALNRAFNRLEAILENPYRQRCDTVMSVRCFKALADALILLKNEVIK